MGVETPGRYHQVCSPQIVLDGRPSCDRSKEEEEKKRKGRNALLVEIYLLESITP